jgi:hypothetical protein
VAKAYTIIMSACAVLIIIGATLTTILAVQMGIAMLARTLTYGHV